MNGYFRGFSILMAGLGGGILVGCLFAPRAGEASRKLIAKRAQKVKRTVQHAVNDGTRFVTRRGAQVRDGAADVIDRGKGVYRAAERMVHAL